MKSKYQKYTLEKCVKINKEVIHILFNDVAISEEKQEFLNNMFCRDNEESIYAFKIKCVNTNINRIINSKINKSDIEFIIETIKKIEKQDLFQQSILVLITDVLRKVDDIEDTESIEKLFNKILIYKLRDYFNENRQLSGYTRAKKEDFPKFKYYSLNDDDGFPEELRPSCTIDNYETLQDIFYGFTELERFFLRKLNEEGYFKPNQMDIMQKLMNNDYVQAAAARDKEVNRSVIGRSVKTIRNKVIKDFIKEYGLKHGIDYIQDDTGEYSILTKEKTLQYLREKHEIENLIRVIKTSDIIKFVKDHLYEFWVEDIVNRLDLNDKVYFQESFVKDHNFRRIRSERTKRITKQMDKKIRSRLGFINKYLAESQNAI